jgi:hypothetical protein
MSLCQTRSAVTTTLSADKIMASATQTITQLPSTASFRPSLIELYLTNLRLLDFDRSPDWPNITAKTYATKDAQNQKQRISCTEWALFRLFELWSPDETQYVRLSHLYLTLTDQCPRNFSPSSHRSNPSSLLTCARLSFECSAS